MKKLLPLFVAFALVACVGLSVGVANARINNPPPSGATGPSSSTDNAIVRWDGAGGSTLQDSGVTIDDSNLMTLPAGFISQAASSTARNLQVQNVFASSTSSYVGALTIDASGFLIIPQGANPTVDAAGEIAEDTTTNGGVTQLVYGAAGNVLTPLIPFSPSAATGTLNFHGNYSTVGTTTVQRDGFPQAVIINSMSCRTIPVSGNGTTTVVIGKGEKASPINSQYIVADDRPTSTPVTLTSNNTFMAGEKINISYGNRIGNADLITCSANVTPLRQ